ncbi:hypothetical protein JOD43_001593 [Pullulanibacillus pueri]|uniref:DUF2515 domain-containing protein n=1 Tax=Pullulanibacillus pueri TaxID=1437324 RepID=A0A8J2ZV15_9BACL|nr:DUF2515 family protein [Pullulanibacillus pueri]MBM7681426.1 hypothetical protein [Pullulanibacillus pueri]GGH78830.1 hypothetical protein GCM10007096_12850 [Pullulanibacillus pueri]
MIKTPTECQKRRKRIVLTIEDHKYIDIIRGKTRINNRDNVSRTKSYLTYYLQHPEITWSLLASMVSRNAGWNMTDLWNEPFLQWLRAPFRQTLFHTYERPNWLIFEDTYPQLLVYALSKQEKKPMFYLLKAFGVSIFIEAEWERYWKEKDGERLYKAQIINEQQLIERPVLKHHFFQQSVFNTMLFFSQEVLKLNVVVFPTLHGELYGYPVSHFQAVNERIELGKNLHSLLFKSTQSRAIQEFAFTVAHTGSRSDYEQFLPHQTKPDWKPGLREVGQEIRHKRSEVQEWFKGKILGQWFAEPQQPAKRLSPYFKKRRLLNKWVSFWS